MFFYNIPFITELINFILFIIFILLAIALSTLVERKIMSTMQRRRGPNVIGMLGFLQPFADGAKLFFKEHTVSANVDNWIFFACPIFTFFCSIKVWMALPISAGDIPMYSEYGVLYILVIMSISVYGIIFAGWSSNSKYAFLGSLRSSSQMISYEICLSFIMIAVVLLTQSIDFIDIVESQRNIWFVFPLFPLWLLFAICGLAETNRSPFDLPEAEAELVAGYNVEYSAIPFALFFLAEYTNILSMSALSTLFFFGGWLPLFSCSFIPGAIWFSIKLSLHVFLFVWVRATLPRYRYDQLMELCWKVILPLIFIFVLVVIISFLIVIGYLSLIY